MDYFTSLKEYEKPRYILLSDFQNFELLDLETNEEHLFSLAELPEKITIFDFIAGRSAASYKDQDPANIEAAALMSNLHEKLAASAYSGKDLEKLLVRIMFCLFADNTNIFNEPQAFLRYIDSTKEDGKDCGDALIRVFQTLDTPEKERQTNISNELAEFPYVNGALFSDLIRTPFFNAEIRTALLQCCYFNWSKVSPALFGSIFQTIMQPLEQRKGGVHYTSEENILKTIHPLFLDDLQAEFIKIRDSRSTQRKSQLEKFHNKLGNLNFLDPACGCGNFLILAYRELRLLEIEVLQALYPTKQGVLDVKALSKIDVDQFYGIEIEEFAAKIAETAMWIVDHQMNIKLSDAFGQVIVRIPLQKSAHIKHANALEMDWKTFIAPEKSSYILGNPPFIGAKYQSQKQRNEIQQIFKNITGAKTLDYVTAWYLKAAQYIQKTPVKVAFVSTNSIIQGEQVGILWQQLFDRYKIHIHFAHRTFKWTLDEKKAEGMYIAAVHCVIIGFANYSANEKYIYDYPEPNKKGSKIYVSNINGYLANDINRFIPKRTKPICDVPEIKFGSQPIDDGNLILSMSEKNHLISKCPEAQLLIRKYIGAEELIHKTERWCLWLKDLDGTKYNYIPEIMERIKRVKQFRLSRGGKYDKTIARVPNLFASTRHPESGNYIIIPSVSSEKREYIPIDIFSCEIIASNLCLIVPNATLYHFGVLTSKLHMD
ncbi:MAG: DNA methyltransferase, partial [Chryseobacterium sp.]